MFITLSSTDLLIMPNPMPFLTAFALCATLMLSSIARADDTEPPLKPAAQRVSLGLRLDATTAPVLPGVGLGGLGGLLGTPPYTLEHGITVGIPLGDSGWRVEPSLSASYTSTEAYSVSTFNLGLMPQRVVASTPHGSLYAGASFNVLRSSSSLEYETLQALENTSISFDIQPLLGVQAMIGPSFAVGFEVGPSLLYTPEQTVNASPDAVDAPSSLVIATDANLTVRYYF